MRVKICGITNSADAGLADRAGADAIGVVVCSDSPRSISIEKAEEIFSGLGPFIARVCVTHTSSPADIAAICEIQPDALQISFPFPREKVPGVRVIRMLQPGSPPRFDCDAVIVDASHGQGRMYNPVFAREIMAGSPVPVILAGGLDPGNVGAAIRDLRPYGVDVATGVELRPGVKDPGKVRAFISASRKEDAG